ncbi:MAG: hypothetical protein ACP5OV_00950 [Acidimicrobiales bacterium]
MVAQVVTVEPVVAPRHLRLVEAPSGPTLTARRAQRARRRSRRHVGGALAVLVAAGAVLGSRSLAWGGATAAGLPTDLATGSQPAAGSVYVVAPGESLGDIAAILNPVDPAAARRALVAELGSPVVLAGEHIVVP